jgi:hypothetical protein
MSEATRLVIRHAQPNYRGYQPGSSGLNSPNLFIKLPFRPFGGRLFPIKKHSRATGRKAVPSNADLSESPAPTLCSKINADSGRSSRSVASPNCSGPFSTPPTSARSIRTYPQNRIPRRGVSLSALVAATLFLAVITGMAGTRIPLEHAGGLDECNRFHAAVACKCQGESRILDSDAMLLPDGHVLVTLQ